MKRIAALFTAAVVGVGTTTCSTPAIASDPEVSALQMGQSDKGWVRTSCIGTGTNIDCDIRVPAGMKTWRVKYVHGGDWIGTEETYPEVAGPHRSRSLVVMKPVDEVRVACEMRGGLSICEVRIRARVTDFDFTLYADRWMQGGLVGEDFEPRY